MTILEEGDGVVLLPDRGRLPIALEEAVGRIARVRRTRADVEIVSGARAGQVRSASLRSLKMRPPTVQECEDAIGIQAAGWEGNCFQVASLLVERRLVGGVAVYGHWLGPIAPRSIFASNRKAGFARHGWVKRADGTVVDPTRWAFEAAGPYIFHGAPDGAYDEGGNAFRRLFIGDPPTFDPCDRILDVDERVMDSATWKWAERALRIDCAEQEPGQLTLRQLSWLANLPPEELGAHAGGVYRAAAKLGLAGIVPIDNRLAHERAHGPPVADSKRRQNR